MQSEVVSLTNLAQGGLVELFDHEMGRVMANIKDVNADPRKKRRITITLDMEPYSDRSGAEITVKVESKLIAVNAIKSNLFVSMVDGQFTAFTRDIRQQELPLEINNVVAMGIKA